MLTIDETLARAWCRACARHARRETILRDGAPYLTRYFLAGWNPQSRQSGPAVFLHHFVASDAADAVHSHPWGWSASVILVGGYREWRCDAAGRATVQEYRPGAVNVIEAAARHRIELLAEDCWTVFLAGDYAQPWSFSPAC
jgi:hypothetical protein